MAMKAPREITNDSDYGDDYTPSLPPGQRERVSTRNEPRRTGITNRDDPIFPPNYAPEEDQTLDKVWQAYADQKKAREEEFRKSRENHEDLLLQIEQLKGAQDSQTQAAESDKKKIEALQEEVDRVRYLLDENLLLVAKSRSTIEKLQAENLTLKEELLVVRHSRNGTPNQCSHCDTRERLLQAAELQIKSFTELTKQQEIVNQSQEKEYRSKLTEPWLQDARRRPEITNPQKSAEVKPQYQEEDCFQRDEFHREPSYRPPQKEEYVFSRQKTHEFRSSWTKLYPEKLPKFNGTSTLVQEWIRDVETMGKMFGIPSQDMVTALQIMLQGPAKDWFKSDSHILFDMHGLNWKSWRSALIERFYDEDKQNQMVVEYLTLNYKSFRSFKKYMSQKYFLRTKAYGEDIPIDQQEESLINQMLQCFSQNARVAIQSAWINKSIMAGTLSSGKMKMTWTQFTKAVEELLSTPTAIKMHDPCSLYHESENKLPPRSDGRQHRSIQGGAGKAEDRPAPFNARCRQCGENSHPTDKCEKSRLQKLQCDICGMRNHTTELHRASQRSKSMDQERGRERERQQFRPRANSQTAFLATTEPEPESEEEKDIVSDHPTTDASDEDDQDFR